MAPSSLKKMSEFQERKEGNYASLEKTPLGSLTNCDLGLTLLPGSQIQRKDEKRSGTAAKSNLKKPGSRYVGRSEQWKSFETDIQQKHAAQGTAFPNEAKSSRSSPDPGPESAKLSRVMARSNRGRPSSQSVSAKDGSGMVRHNGNSVATPPYTELIMGTGEIGNSNSCQHDDSSPRAMKRRKLGSRASNEMRDSKISKGKEVAFETHYNQSHVHHDQDLSKINAVHSEKTKPSVATIGVPFSEIGGGLGSSKLESHRQITHSPDAASALFHQSTVLESENTALHGNSSALAALALKSPAKHQHSEPEKLTVHYQPPTSSKSVSTQFWKYSRLFPDTPADIRTQVLKPRKEVNKSWTSHFPAKAKIRRRANLPAPSFLAVPFTPSEHLINALLASTDLHAYTHFSSTHPSPSLPNYLSLSKAFSYPLDVCALEDIFDTVHAGNRRQSARRRSASMPNLSSTCVPMNMDSSHCFGPASMPTPPREQPSSPAHLPFPSPLSHYDNAPFCQNLVDPPRGHVNTSFNTGNSSSQNWQLNSNFQRQHEKSLSDTQNIGFPPSHHPRQVLTQPSNHQDMTGPSVSKDEAMAAGGPQYSRQRLEVKPNYSHEEVKALMYNLVGQAQVLKAENIRLQSLNTAAMKGFESLQHGKADMIQQIQRHERTAAQKDQQIKALEQKGYSLQNQYKRLWDEHNGLLATIRKENGTGKPSAIAKKIRWNHSPNAVGGAGQGRQTSANVSPVHYANGAQLPIPRHVLEQTPTGFQGLVQPVSFSAYSEANGTNVSSRSLCQPGFASANHDDANQPQPVSIPAYPEVNVANASSRASVQPGFAAANHNSANSLQDGPTGWVPSNQPADATFRTVTTNDQNYNRPTEQVPMERVTIDLTDDSQPPSSSASCDTSVHQTRESSVQGGHPPFYLPPGKHPPAQYPAGHFASSQYPSGPSAHKQMSQNQLPLDQDSQGKNLEAMQIQKEAIARMAEKPLSWLQGENPFRKGAKTGERVGLPNSRRSSQSNAEENFFLAQPSEAGSVAPLPETANGRKTKNKVPKKTRVILDAEAKKERAKVYRKTAAEKKKREKEIAKQLLQDGNMSNNAMRAQKQDRRAAKGVKRQEQARKPSEEVGSREPQKTLDGRLYREDTSVRQSMHQGSMEQAASDDHDSLFGDDEDNEMEVEFRASPDEDSVMHDNKAAADGDVDPAVVAELEALLEADVDAGTTTGDKQDDAFGGETGVLPGGDQGGDHGYHDFSSESEESEEE